MINNLNNRYNAPVYHDFTRQSCSAQTCGGLNPLPPKGHLVENHLLTGPKYFAKDYLDSAKTFYQAVTKGEGNDYSIGKLNDFAVRTSGLGFALLLQSKAKSLLGKTMEFVGFGTWFLGMSILPKFFIGNLVKIFKGIDINQEYVSSQGYRKKFFQDSQFIPWDLMKPEELDKIGDKLKIPRNIKDRRQAIREKVKQVTIQANTLCTLAAGFSPVLVSLIADFLRKPVSNIVETISIQRAKSKIPVKSEIGYKGVLEALVGKASNLQNQILKPNFEIDTAKKAEFEKIINEGKSEQVNKFFRNKFGKNKYQNHIFSKLDKIIGDQKTLSEAQKNEIKGLLSNTKDLSKLMNYYTRTLGNKAGSQLANEWQEVPEKILGKLGINTEKLSKCTDINKSIDIIVEHFQDLAKDPEKVKTLKNNTDVIVKQAVKKSREAGTYINTCLDKLKGPLFESQELRKLIKNKANNRILNAQSSWGRIPHILDRLSNGELSSKEKLAEVIRGITIDNVCNEYKKLAPDSIKSKLAGYIGHLDKNTFEKAHDIIIKQDQSQFRTLNKWLGKTPQNLLQDASKEFQAHRVWTGKAGIIAGSVLGISLLVTSFIGKRNPLNPDKYVERRD